MKAREKKQHNPQVKSINEEGMDELDHEIYKDMKEILNRESQVESHEESNEEDDVALPECKIY